MNDQPLSAPPKKNASKRISPLLLLLILPLLGIFAAILTFANNNTPTLPITPPSSYFTPDSSVIGSPAPEFELTSVKGEKVSLKQWRGQWVLVNFWATWCIPCQREMPTFQKIMVGEYGDLKGKLMVLAINREESASLVQDYVAKNNIPDVPILLDSDAKVNNTYYVLRLPMTFIIDPNGDVYDRVIGEFTPALLDKYLQVIDKGLINGLTDTLITTPADTPTQEIIR